LLLLLFSFFLDLDFFSFFSFFTGLELSSSSDLRFISIYWWFESLDWRLFISDYLYIKDFYD